MPLGAGFLKGAGHILTTAQRGFDLAVPIRAFRDLHCCAIGLGQFVVDQGLVAVCAGSIYGHVAFVTFVGCHHFLQKTASVYTAGGRKRPMPGRPYHYGDFVSTATEMNAAFGPFMCSELEFLCTRCTTPAPSGVDDEYLIGARAYGFLRHGRGGEHATQRRCEVPGCDCGRDGRRRDGGGVCVW